MDANVEAILRKTAEYIEMTQPALDKAAERREEFLRRAQGVAKKLAAAGIISAESVDAFNTKIAANETEVWSLVERLVDAVGSQETMGSGVSEKLASQGQITDPFEKWVLFGSPRADAGTRVMLE